MYQEKCAHARTRTEIEFLTAVAIAVTAVYEIPFSYFQLIHLSNWTVSEWPSERTRQFIDVKCRQPLNSALLPMWLLGHA